MNQSKGFKIKLFESKNILVLTAVLSIFLTGCALNRATRAETKDFLPQYALRATRIDSIDTSNLWIANPTLNEPKQEEIAPFYLNPGESYENVTGQKLIVQSKANQKATLAEIEHLYGDIDVLMNRINVAKEIAKKERGEAQFIIDQYRDSCKFSVEMLLDRINYLESRPTFGLGILSGGLGLLGIEKVLNGF